MIPGDLNAIFGHYKLDAAQLRATLQRTLGDLRSGNPGKPVFSSLLLEWFQDAWVYISTEVGEFSVRSGALLVRLVVAPNRYLPAELPSLEQIPRDELRKDMASIAAGSVEEGG